MTRTEKTQGMPPIAPPGRPTLLQALLFLGLTGAAAAHSPTEPAKAHSATDGLRPAGGAIRPVTPIPPETRTGGAPVAVLWEPEDGRHVGNGDGYPQSPPHGTQEAPPGSAHPPLIPMPQRVDWRQGAFRLKSCRGIRISDSTLLPTAARLREGLGMPGLPIRTAAQASPSNGHWIDMRKEEVDAPLHRHEAYRLEVSEGRVEMTAANAHGMFNGASTLLQLADGGGRVEACSITDWPAYAWRGYMIDVGRNYLPVERLLENIDVMARHKLNVFHLHLTEDVAWRLAIRKYPQLTRAENMVRQKGMYYSEEDMHRLIAYCRERHITFVPEIDMPGHSAAFRRAMGTDMQSDSGMAFVKEILHEVLATYDIPYMHIGADEVRIDNPRFIPEMTALIRSHGREVVGWQPGGNFDKRTIRQLWQEDNGRITGAGDIPYIDSRHLYLNHMDPLEAVTTLFHRRIANRTAGDSMALGATLCTWHDRAAAREEDVMRMNPVYPGMLAFAERIWRGGGRPGWIANISDGDSSAFREFEDRLLHVKGTAFRDKPFPYQRQSHLQWRLLGPYANGGDLARSFAPESGNPDTMKAAKTVTGGTIVLRHWWHPRIKGAIDPGRDSTTWYAYTKIWSDRDGYRPFWVGFFNMGRAQATDAPPKGEWDRKKSGIRVNGEWVPPPAWQRAGQPGHLETPFTDEGYEYRPPTMIRLRKGWNEVLMKAPMGSLASRDWHNPVKWMFTLVPVED